MQWYIDITLLPNIETNIGFIWQRVYGQIHLALVEQKTAKGNSTIAVSFPEYGSNDFPLGQKLRLIASTSEQLEQLNLAKYLNRATDYCHRTSIKEIPVTVNQYVRFKRKWVKSNVERLARRRAKRKGETFEIALTHYSDFEEQKSKLPYINMISLSKGEHFLIFVEREFVNQPEKSEFSCYGLGGRGTVPWF